MNRAGHRRTTKSWPKRWRAPKTARRVVAARRLGAPRGSQKLGHVFCADVERLKVPEELLCRHPEDAVVHGVIRIDAELLLDLWVLFPSRPVVIKLTKGLSTTP